MEEVELEQLKSEFSKLISQIDELPNRKKIFEEALVLIDDFARTSGHISILLGIGSRAQVTTSPLEFSLFQMPLFLWIFEGQYVRRLDYVCLMLTACGHDLFNPSNREYASTLDKIGAVDTSTKFKFLARHKMKMLIRKRDQQLRNKIAHQDFHIDEKGIISVNNKVVDMHARITDLQSFVRKITTTFTECIRSSLPAPRQPPP